jgi:hypothetical protein
MPGRDFEVSIWADLVVAEPGDGCPVCGGVLTGARGIEVSQIFQLGTKYSTSMKATFADENGDEQPFLMGCYGVGVSRSMAAVVEQNNDEGGMAWPMTVAPLEVAVLPLMAEGEVAEVAERIWREFAQAGVEAVIDDRDERAGVKFNDADHPCRGREEGPRRRRGRDQGPQDRRALFGAGGRGGRARREARRRREGRSRTQDPAPLGRADPGPRHRACAGGRSREHDPCLAAFAPRTPSCARMSSVRTNLSVLREAAAPASFVA